MCISIRRVLLMTALLCTTGLTACLEEQQKDPQALSDAGKVNGNFYASALGNMAVRIQNSIVSDPTWFTSANSSALDLAAMGIESEINGATVHSHVCPTGTGTQVVQITWVEGHDANNNFKLKGVGTDTGTIIGALRERAAPDQIGTFNGQGRMTTANNTSFTFPSSCASLAIPTGTPVLAFKIDRPAAPIENLARTEFRTVACDKDVRGKDKAGTKVEKRIVQYNSDGEIHEGAWQTENIGTCVAIDEIKIDQSESKEVAGLVNPAEFAALAETDLKKALTDNLSKINCSTAKVTSDTVVDGEGQHLGSQKTSAKNIDTCAKGANARPGQELKDDDQSDLPVDTRNICLDKWSTFNNKSFLSVSTGSLSTHMSGFANVDRIIDKVSMNSDSTARGERQKWVGSSISCHIDDRYTVQCGNVPNEPSGPDISVAGGKWIGRDLQGYFVDEGWWDSVFNFCFDCTNVTGGGLYLLNWNYFNSKQTMHDRVANTTQAVGARHASAWSDAVSQFIPQFLFGAYHIENNQCLIVVREIQLDCPLYYDANKQAGWYPYELPTNAGWYTTLIPGGSYGGDAGRAYNDARNKGDTPGYVWVNFEHCYLNIKGYHCDYWTETAGPGTDAYIKSWTYGQGNSVDGSYATVQTIMMNKDGQIREYRPEIVGGPALAYQGRYTTPLHCGRIERGTYSSGWPTLHYYTSCWRNGKGWSCGTFGSWGSTTIEFSNVREWLGSDTVNGTWSQPNAVYTSPYGTWSHPSQIPNPIIY